MEGDEAATLRFVVERKSTGTQKLGDDESYHLVVKTDAVTLTSTEPLGALRGLETLLQLVGVTTQGFAIPAVDITDQPRFPWRGLSLDVSRHFIPFDEIKRTIDGLAMVKMNVFHWHLSDDQGFRIESKRYPRLHEYGSDGLYYTQTQVREVIAYAHDRGVRVVPEFDMPGHATSWLVGYPALATGKGPYKIIRDPGVLTATMDPTKPGTYVFLDGFIGEMTRLFPDAYFHIGGDEVAPKGEWATQPHIAAFMKKNRLQNLDALQTYFNRRILKIVAKYGKKMEGWDEILNPELPKTSMIQSWRGQKSLAEAARQGYSGILSSGYYLDLMQPAGQLYAVDPLKIEPGKDDPAAAPLTAEQQKLILGGEAAMWEELATQENIDAKLWPRTAAIAERLWSAADVTDAAFMYRRLVPVSQWLDGQGMQHVAQLRRMRARLAGPNAALLTEFAAILEPVKGYTRHRAKKYSMNTPFNRLVDSIAPESDAAREFRDATDRFLLMATDPESLRARLLQWRKASTAILPVLSDNALLQEDMEVARAMDDLCAIGLETLDLLRAGKKLTPDRAQNMRASIDGDSKPKADMLIQITPAVRALFERAQP